MAVTAASCSGDAADFLPIDFRRRGADLGLVFAVMIELGSGSGRVALVDQERVAIRIVERGELDGAVIVDDRAVEVDAAAGQLVNDILDRARDVQANFDRAPGTRSGRMFAGRVQADHEA